MTNKWGAWLAGASHARRKYPPRLMLLPLLGLSSLACGGTATTTSDGPAAHGPTSSAGKSNGYAGTAPDGVDASTSYGGSSGATAHNVQCESPTVDPVTALVRCSNGFAHRPTAASCAPVAGDFGSGGATGAACEQDDDCPTDHVCVCDGSTRAGQCVAAQCHLDSECGGSSLCILIPGMHACMRRAHILLHTSRQMHFRLGLRQCQLPRSFLYGGQLRHRRVVLRAGALISSKMNLSSPAVSRVVTRSLHDRSSTLWSAFE
jgi:hypothetical protein